MNADEEREVRAVIDKAVAAGMDRGQLTWAIEGMINMPPATESVIPTEAAAAEVAEAFGMSVGQYIRIPDFPPGTTPEQIQAAKDYVRGRLRRLNW